MTKTFFLYVYVCFALLVSVKGKGRLSFSKTLVEHFAVELQFLVNLLSGLLSELILKNSASPFSHTISSKLLILMISGC